MLRARHTAARALILRSGRSPYLEGRGRLLHPSRRALVRAPQSLQRNADLILRSLRSKRLEGWTQRADLWPSFETRARRAPQDEVGDMFAAVGWAKRSVPTIQDRDRISGGHGARGAFAHPTICSHALRMRSVLLRYGPRIQFSNSKDSSRNKLGLAARGARGLI